VFNLESPGVDAPAGDYAMKKHITQSDSATAAAETTSSFRQTGLTRSIRRPQPVRDFIETMMEEELDAVLSRPRYGRIAPGPGNAAGAAEAVTGHRHGHRSRSLLGTFGPVEIAMPRARLNARAAVRPMEEQGAGKPTSAARSQLTVDRRHVSGRDKHASRSVGR